MTRRSVRDALTLGAGTLLLTYLLQRLSAPSPALFAGVAVGLTLALTGRGPVVLPRGSARGGQAVLGVSIGALVTTATLRELGRDLLPVLVVSLVTLALSVAAGSVLTRRTGVDRATGAFGMIAGGASGVVAIARELGADERLVAVMQYLRVLLVVLTAPVVAAALPAPAGTQAPGTTAEPGLLAVLLFVLATALLGLALARATRLPAGGLLGPLVVSGVVAAVGLDAAARGVPSWLQSVAVGVIGLQVGLSFTRGALSQARRLVLPSLGAIAALILACAGLGALLSLATGASAVDGYLATTPGGLYAVLAASVDTGGDVTFVLAVQVVRVLLMLGAAPLLARRLRSR